MADDNEQIHLNSDQARAASTPHVARHVLVASLVLIVLIFAIILLWGRF